MAGSVRLWPRSRAAGVFLHLFIGLPMAAGGVLTLAAPGIDLAYRLAGAAMFLAMGAIVSVRHQIRYWPDRAAIETMWSLLVPLRRRFHPLAGFETVAVKATESGGGEFATTTRISYQVVLCGPAASLEIDGFGAEAAAVAEANRVASLVRLPVTPGVVDFEPYDWGPAKSARFTIVFGAALMAAGTCMLGLMLWLSDWTRWIPLPFLLFFSFWGVTLLWMGISRAAGSHPPPSRPRPP